MYTDGVTETANPSDERFGGERFKEFIKARGDQPADAFADPVLQELASWSKKRSGRANKDDLALIVVDIA